MVTTNSARFTAGDSYEPMSTEPTPNQVQAQSDLNNNHYPHAHAHAHHHHHIYHNQQNIAPKNPYHHSPRQFSGSRRHVNRTTAAAAAATQLNADDNTAGGVTNHQPGHYNDPLGDSVDLIDDIHTTRSSLVGTNQHNLNEANQNNKNQNQQLGGGGGGVGSSQVDQNQLPLSSLTLHGPYGSMPASMNNLLLHNTNHKLETSGSLIEPDDMTNSFSRLPGLSSTVNNNLTDNLFNDYNLASAIGNSLNNSNSTQQQQQQQLLSSAMLANLLGTVPNSNSQDSSVTSSNTPDIFNQQQTTTPTPTHHRAFSSLLPISVLLTDLLKLTRPHTSNEQQNRPSILQQSRLPSSFLNLLQGITNNGNNGNTNLPDLNSFINHDASESSQHYHRVSMSPTDIHSILARSLGNSGVLPAFPAPKGVTQTWIPPTSGGNPDYNSAFNSNADFVAGNVAGFVRTSPVTSTSEQVPHQFSNNQQPPMDTSYQRQSVGNTDLPSNPQIDNVQQQAQQQQFQQGSSFGSIDELQSQPVLPATSAGLNNEHRSWIRSSNGPISFNNQNFQNNVLRQPTGANELDNARRVFKTNAAPISMAQTSNQQNLASTGPGFNAGIMLANDIQTPQQNFNQQQQQPKSAFNPNSPSEIQVPLGYSPPTQQLQQQQRIQIPSQQPHNIQQIRASFESSSPKQMPVNQMQQASSIKPQVVMNQASQQQQQQVLRNQQQSLVSIPNRMQTKANTLNRKKRAIKSSNDMDRVDEYMSSKYGASDDDEEDDGDLRPISVVSPDGKPMNSGRVRSSSTWRDNNSPDITPNDENSKLIKKRKKNNNNKLLNDRQVAQSQRSANHLDSRGSRRFNRDQNDNNIVHLSLEDPADDHHRGQLNRRQRFKLQNGLQEDSMVVDELASEKSLQDRKKGSNSSSRNNNKNTAPLDAAGSGLMSKLLGTASTNDELEEELDDDDDSTNEKKKEDIDDAEFGIVNDERQNNPQDVMRGMGVAGRSDSGGGSDQADLNKQMQPGSSVESGLGSGSTDNESYMRRNQQRSDIEFYGHPGEETRQLKYGILGSGNYEVVDGGIYPEADESTAAVNSVANYVRKPGALLSNLPKLLSEQVVNTQTSFMPGGRVGSFLRGASTNPDDLVGGLIATELAANKDPLSSPLLELIDANNAQLFDPNILSQIGSSGSSARTTHTGKELLDSTNQDRDNSSKQRNKKKGIKHYNVNKLKSNKSNYANNGEQNDLENLDQQDEDSGDDAKQEQQQQTATRLKGNTRTNKEFNSGQLQQQQSSISGSRSQGTNQFNSYQILPSKKVTIFSDQDLDSAPSEQKFALQQPLTAKFPL